MRTNCNTSVDDDIVEEYYDTNIIISLKDVAIVLLLTFIAAGIVTFTGYMCFRATEEYMCNNCTKEIVNKNTVIDVDGYFYHDYCLDYGQYFSNEELP